MLAGHQPWIDFQSAGANVVVVITLAELHSPELDDFQPPPLRSILARQVLQPDHSVHDALQIAFSFARRVVVQQDDGAVPAGKVLLEGQ